MSDRDNEPGGIVVVGLGRFGGHLAGALIRLDHEVLAIDRNADLVQRWSDQLDRVAQADATDEDTLRQLGVAEFRRAVVAIGASVEASVLTVLALVELGVPQVWARATSAKHAKILASVGAHHVIFPEAETGEHVAHLIVTRMLDFIEFGDDFALAKVRVRGPSSASRWPRCGRSTATGCGCSAPSCRASRSSTPRTPRCSARTASWWSRAASNRCSASRR